VISFCDDLNILSPSLKQGQQLLDICSAYGEKWKIKFNPTKSNIMEFGKKIYKALSLTVNGKIIEKVKEMKILGYWFDESLNSNNYIIRSFESVRKSFFSLNMFGMKPNGLNPFLQAFLYNTFCLSKSTYCLELMNLDEKTINLMNVMQNGLVRYMLKLHKSCHMSNILKSLKIVNIKQLIFKYKINFVRQLENHELCKEIFKRMINNRNGDSNNNNNNKSKSIIMDLERISNILDCKLEEVGKTKLKSKQLEKLDEKFNRTDEDVERVKFCLENINDVEIKNILITLTNSFERKIKIIENIENLGALETNI